MGRCDVCGNDHEKTMVMTIPDGRYFCCANCAALAGIPSVR